MAYWYTKYENVVVVILNILIFCGDVVYTTHMENRITYHYKETSNNKNIIVVIKIRNARYTHKWVEIEKKITTINKLKMER